MMWSKGVVTAGFKRYFSSNRGAKNEGPLSNVRVLDLTRIVAGPYCTMILGDMGADVIKIEHPEGGDETRKWGPPYINDTSETCYFMCLNRNKRSVCVNLKTPQGVSAIKELASRCDVFVENYVPGSLDRLGLGYSDISKVSPGIVYCSLTGYGSRGLYKNRPGYDVIASSIGGLMNITGPADGDPCKVGVAMTDIATGLYAHGAIIAALLKRFTTGKGQKIDCNLLSTQLACLINIGSNYLNANWEGSRWGSSHPSIVPYRSYKTKDGKFITVGAGSDKQFEDLCQRIGLLNILIDSKFKTNKDRVSNREELDKQIAAKFLEKLMAEWLVALEGGSFPYGPVNSLAEAFEDTHVKDIGLVRELEHPVAGRIRLVGPAVDFSHSTVQIKTPPPTLGQHTTEVLSGVLGYSEERIDDLRRKGAVA